MWFFTNHIHAECGLGIFECGFFRAECGFCKVNVFSFSVNVKSGRRWEALHVVSVGGGLGCVWFPLAVEGLACGFR